MDEVREAVGRLVDQHREIDGLFGRTLAASGELRTESFAQLRRLVAVHESVEELLVHPRMRWLLTDGDALARARVEEETRIKELLIELESMDFESPEFAAGLEQVRALAMVHNRTEEIDEFPALADELDEKHRARLRRGIAVAEKVAPTRPHPGLALGGEQLLAGGFASLSIARET